MTVRLLLAVATVLLAQDADEVRRAVGDTTLVGPWIYEDVTAGFAEARKTGKPLAVFLRCVP